MSTRARSFSFASLPDTFDLDRYLTRIGYAGPRAETREVLQALHRHHVQAIPFENLDAVLDVPIALDVESLQRKLVRSRRGGYCYEQNLLFAHALDALGFHVTGLLARVRHDVPADVVTPRSHMALRVEVGGDTFLADVGFGGQTLTRPLPLRPGVSEGTRLDTYRLRAVDEAFLLESRIGDEFVPLYIVDPYPQHRVDYEVANWYVSTHPRSPMTQRVFASRWHPDRRVTLKGDVFTTHHLDGRRDRRRVDSVAALRAALLDEFGIELPDDADLDEALALVVEPRTAAS